MREAGIVTEKQVKDTLHQLFLLSDQVSEAPTENNVKELTRRQKWLWHHTNPNVLLITKRDETFFQSAISLFYFMSDKRYKVSTANYTDAFL